MVVNLFFPTFANDMKIVETENIRKIVILYLINDTGRSIYNITESVEDAYDIAQVFLWDTFNLTKEEVLSSIRINEGDKKPDYVDIYNPEKVDYWKDLYDEEHNVTLNKTKERTKYYFRIVIDHTVKVTGTRN